MSPFRSNLLSITGLWFDLQRGFDVFNALDLMENKEFLEKLKFGIGDGNLQYYLYNWKCPFMEPAKVSQIALESILHACNARQCASLQREFLSF